MKINFISLPVLNKSQTRALVILAGALVISFAMMSTSLGGNKKSLFEQPLVKAAGCDVVIQTSCSPLGTSCNGPVPDYAFTCSYWRATSGCVDCSMYQSYEVKYKSFICQGYSNSEADQCYLDAVASGCPTDPLTPQCANYLQNCSTPSTPCATCRETVTAVANCPNYGSGSYPPEVTLVASPSSVSSGNSTTLSWTVSGGATSCTASGNWSGSKNVSGGSEVRSNITANQTYTLTCTNADGSGSASDSVTVTPPAPPGPTAACSPSTQTIPVGGTASFTGDTTGISLGTCSWIAVDGSPANSGARPNAAYCPSFSTTYNTAGNYTVTYSVRDRFGFPYLDYCDVSVTNAPAPNPPSVSISASPTSVTSGGSSTLTWTVSGGTATSCVASGGWSGNKSTSGGSQLVTGITSSTGYTITCSNADGSDADSVTVSVTGGGGSAPSVSLSATPTSVTSGGSSTLTWTVSGGATSCTASGDWSGSKSTSGGSQLVTNITTNKAYVLTCTNSNGSDNDSATVTISGPSTYSLTTIRSGQGTVTSSPGGINCGGTCNATYDDGTDVTLTATPNPGWRFTGWGGDCSGTNPQCTLTINGSKSVTASFRPNLVYEEF